MARESRHRGSGFFAGPASPTSAATVDNSREENRSAPTTRMKELEALIEQQKPQTPEAIEAQIDRSIKKATL